jgi:two-component sensor histidine kinase
VTGDNTVKAYRSGPRESSFGLPLFFSGGRGGIIVAIDHRRVADSRAGANAPLSSLRIVGLYALFAAAWILFSDTALHGLVKDPLLVESISIAKGWLFVLVTSLLLYSLVARELSGRARLEAELRSRLEEKRLLLRELHHRVNNNLQIVGSILGMENDLLETEGDRRVIEAARERILAMGMVHAELSRVGDLTRIDLGQWMGQLGPILADSLSGAGLLSLDLEPIEVGMDRALPCGLILAEGLSNAIRHGCGSPVRVSLCRLDGERAELVIRDGGPGFPAEVELEGGSARGIGLFLVGALAAQLGGNFERRSESGAVFRLVFPTGRVPSRPALSPA